MHVSVFIGRAFLLKESAPAFIHLIEGRIIERAWVNVGEAGAGDDVIERLRAHGIKSTKTNVGRRGGVLGDGEVLEAISAEFSLVDDRAGEEDPVKAEVERGVHEAMRVGAMLAIAVDRIGAKAK